jgi:hypothetical protein
MGGGGGDAGCRQATTASSVFSGQMVGTARSTSLSGASASIDLAVWRKHLCRSGSRTIVAYAHSVFATSCALNVPATASARPSSSPIMLGNLEPKPAEKDQHRFLQECVFFNHAAKHGDEVLKCARELCEKYGFKQELENLEDVGKKTKPQCDNSQLLDQARADKERAMKTSAEGSSAKGEGGISKKQKRSTDSSKRSRTQSPVPVLR